MLGGREKNSKLNICHPVLQKADNNICPSHLSSDMVIRPLHFMTFPFFCKDSITIISQYHSAFQQMIIMQGCEGLSIFLFCHPLL